MIQVKDNGTYHEVTKVFAGGAVQQEVIKIWSTDANDWVYEATDTVSGALPLTFHADGSALVDYQIYGANGGVGDRTENLFNGYFEQGTTAGGVPTASNNRVRSNIVAAVAGTFSINFKNEENFDVAFDFWDGDTLVEATSWLSTKNYITPNNATSVRIKIRKSNDNPVTPAEIIDFGMYPGSTVPASYEPFGYKLDMSVSDGTNTTITPIYIGDEPLWAVNTYADCADYQKQKVTRAIKKYVLTGDENWETITGAYASRTYFRYVFAPINYCVRHVCTSSHFTQASITTATTIVGFDVFDSTSVNGEVLAIRPGNVQSTTLTDFKAWLAEQYAAGTPVTVWCSLITAEETDPPVPLPALPTREGETVVDYDGTPAPSSVYLSIRKAGDIYELKH